MDERSDALTICFMDALHQGAQRHAFGNAMRGQTEELGKSLRRIDDAVGQIRLPSAKAA
nr:hypothetical protein [Methylobacterium soli]